MPDDFTHTEIDLGQTIPSVSDGDEVEDFSQLREEFRIFPGEDGSEYRNLRLLGMGGMGVVYSADDPTLERHVALKILREPYRQKRDQISKFVNEARITAKIDHPNIVAVHQLGVNEHNGVYFSMRRISGETLQNAIRRLREGDPEARRLYTRRRLLDIFIAGCNGVAAAHEKKILHCDLKPANIMIGSFGEVLVLDWGLAREFDAPPSKKIRSISGTPAFMAPELVTGDQKIPDVKTEVYALGMILYSILSWNPSPFDQTADKNAILEKVALGKYIPLRPPKGESRNRELYAICEKAIHRERDKRYQSVAELINDLHNFRDGYPVAAYSPNIFYRFFKLCRRHPTIPLAVIGAVITLLVHAGTVRILDYAHDRSIKRSSLINLDIAENYYRQTMPKFQRKANPDQPDSLLRLSAARKDLEMQAQLALMEYFSVIESISRLSPAGQRQFGREHGADIFLQILSLNIAQGNIHQLQDNLTRCENSTIFHIAMQNDPKLRQLVENIRKNTGCIFFIDPDGKPCRRSADIFFKSDGTSQPLQIDESGMAELPAGDCWIKFDNHVNMHLRVVPGSRISLRVPDTPENKNFFTIPADHFFIQLPGVGEFLCELPEFTVAIFPDEKLMTHEDAEKLISEFKKHNPGKWRLPSAAEWYKINGKDAVGKQGFYGIPDDGKAPILLLNGDFFSHLIQRTTRIVPNKLGKVYLVKLNNDNDIK